MAKPGAMKAVRIWQVDFLASYVADSLVKVRAYALALSFSNVINHRNASGGPYGMMAPVCLVLFAGFAIILFSCNTISLTWR